MAALVLASLATAPPAGGAPRHDHARRHARRCRRTRSRPAASGLRDYRLWLGLVLAITTALFYPMR